MARRKDAVPEEELAQVKDWDAVLSAALAATGGSITVEERTWADDVLGTASRGSV